MIQTFCNISEDPKSYLFVKVSLLNDLVSPMPDSQMEANSVSAWRNGWMDLRLGFKMSGNRTLADAML